MSDWRSSTRGACSGFDVEFSLNINDHVSVDIKTLVRLVNPSQHPEWLAGLAESVATLMHAHDVLAPVGCHYHEEEDLCEVLVFASQTEVYGGRRDGRHLPSRYTLDVHGLVKLFTSVEAMEWQALRHDSDDEIGAHLALVGDYQGRRLCLRVPAKAPACFEPGRIANVLEGRFINMW